MTNTGSPGISTSNRMARRAIWDKSPEVVYKKFQNHPERSEGDLIFFKHTEGDLSLINRISRAISN